VPATLAPSCGERVEPRADSGAMGASAAAPAIFAKVRLETFLLDDDLLLNDDFLLNSSEDSQHH
jgi:hypothetical protein